MCDKVRTSDVIETTAKQEHPTCRLNTRRRRDKSRQGQSILFSSSFIPALLHLAILSIPASITTEHFLSHTIFTTVFKNFNGSMGEFYLVAKFYDLFVMNSVDALAVPSTSRRRSNRVAISSSFAEVDEVTVMNNSSVGRRVLPPKGGGGDDTSDSDGDGNYTGCLSMSIDELKEAWQWPGDMPECTGGVSDSSASSSSASNEYNAYSGTFDISDCQSYSNLWLWDLALSCDDVDTLTGCECTFAEELLYAKKIQCAKTGDKSPPSCPEDCNVCQTCMTLLGCDDIYASTSLSVARNFLPYMIAGGIGLALTGFLLYNSSIRKNRRKKSFNNKTPSHFIEIDTPSPTRVVPMHRQSSQETNHVWLAPMLL